MMTFYQRIAIFVALLLCAPLMGADSPSWASAVGEDELGRWAELRVGEATQRFRWIRPGSFGMGSSQEQLDAILRDNPDIDPKLFLDETPHRVVLTKGFWPIFYSSRDEIIEIP